MTSTVDVTTDHELKDKHRAVWASGDYPAVAEQLIPSLGPQLVSAAGVPAGQRVLDVAAGSGNAAIPAAATGAAVTALDLTPELLDAGQRIAADRGVRLDWVLADAEALPFGEDTFDVVLSCVGAMFAPHHQVVADELVRVTRPGGMIAMINWSPEGFIGNLLQTMGRYAPPPPPGASPPARWGDEAHVRGLFGDRVLDVAVHRRTVVMNHSPSPAAFREYWKRNYGPVIAVYRHNAADPARTADLDRDFLPLLQQWNRVDTAGGSGYPAEFLLFTARKA